MNNEDKKNKSPVDNTKRQLAKAGIGIPLLSLASKPVWARRLNCTFSGQLSGNMSPALGGAICEGEGLSPGYWSQHPEDWCGSIPALNYVGTATLFKDVFSDSIRIEEGGQGQNILPAIEFPTMLEVMLRHADAVVEPDGSITDNMVLKQCTNNNANNIIGALGFHAVAAFQNACSPIHYDLTTQEVIAMYNAAVLTCDPKVMEDLKDELDALNNQGLNGTVFP